jgi:two-component system, OmpR family, sensor histidine kinase KdpD
VLHRITSVFRKSAVPVLRGSALLALVTFAAYKLHLNAAGAGFLYLTVVTLNCLNSSFPAAVVVSILAVACLDFFFVEPLLTFTVADPIDGVALVSFLITSVAITRLSSRAREQAQTATQGRRNTECLYEAAHRLVALRPSGSELPAMMLAIFRDIFGFKAGCIFDANAAEVHTVGEAHPSLADKTRGAYIMGRDTDEPLESLSCRTLRASSCSLGAIGFEGLEEARLLAGPLAALAAAGMDRAIAAWQASQSAAEAKAETLRSAILDALAHEFKTPLATILTAAGGLREAGPLRPAQSELADIVESEAERLSQLSARLLSLARLDRDELKPRFEVADSVSVVAPIIDRYSAQYPAHRLILERTANSEEILADMELLQLAVSQLIDNACRYSSPGGPVRVVLEADATSVGIVVWNSGSSIPPTDSGRVFDRFYRGMHAQRVASGTGLGLYIAKKIAVAHGGNLELDSKFAAGNGVAFRLTIPLAPRGSDVVARV